MVASWLEPAPEPLTGTLRASDGDSFHYGAERIRLLGIDAPELEQTCMAPGHGTWPCGEAARDQLARLLRDGVTCAREGRDWYGRVLARCNAAEHDIGSALVANGWAVAVDDYWTEEQAARGKKLGIWAGSFMLPKQWRDAHGIADLSLSQKLQFERLLRPQR